MPYPQEGGQRDGVEARSRFKVDVEAGEVLLVGDRNGIGDEPLGGVGVAGQIVQDASAAAARGEMVAVVVCSGGGDGSCGGGRAGTTAVSALGRSGEAQAIAPGGTAGMVVVGWDGRGGRAREGAGATPGQGGAIVTTEVQRAWRARLSVHHPRRLPRCTLTGCRS